MTQVPDTAGLEAVFVPADPPRAGVLALWSPGGADRADRAPSTSGGSDESTHDVEVVLPAGSRVRRTRVPARLVPVPEALALLCGPQASANATASYRAWASAALAGVGLVARGRLRPAASPQGYGAWRAGPLDPGDRAWLAKLVAAMPPAAHALPVPGSRPLRMSGASTLVQAFWDAIADTLARDPEDPIEPAESAEPARSAKPNRSATSNGSAEPKPSALTPFSAFAPTELTEPVATWLAEDEAATESDPPGAKLVLRIQPPEIEPPDVEPADVDPPVEEQPGDRSPDEENHPADGATAPTPPFRGVLQLRSAVDPSLLVDVADLWAAPAAVLARLGSQAETDLLLGLRRGARAWPPLGAALTAATPAAIDLADTDVEDLLTRGAEALDLAGTEVLWPKELGGGALSLKAKATTPRVAGAGEPAFSLRQMLEFRWQPTLDGAELTEEEIAALAEAKRPFLWLRGRWVRVDRQLLDRLRRRGPRTLGAAEALAAALSGELAVDDEQVEFVPDERIGRLAELLAGVGAATDITAPPDLAATLRPYQQRGLAWLAQLTGLGLGGCLADDMGLGKTVQLIAVHLHRRSLRLGPTLVVCPTTLLGTWQRELHRFAPTTPVRRYHGGARHLSDLAPDEVVLTTYGVVRRDSAELADTRWGLVVADEAQHAKNPLARTARALRTIPGAARIALTGTPVENHLSELWSILDWTTPGLLGPLERFRQKVAVPIERYRDPAATERLARVTAPFLLRRRKSDPGIAPELPPKTESDVVVGLTTEQATLYKAVVTEVMAEIQESEGVARRGLVLALLTALKQVCNHPAQYLHESGPLPGRSGKLAALDDLLDVILAEGESVLIFSQYVEMCRLLQDHLDRRGVRNLFLHGGITARKREHLVAEFQAGAAPVFLLSLKAGGVGLTLTRATHVVHFDRWWNPAVENQATDRAYRIGQDRPVQVHRLVTEGTLEDRIAAVIEAKRELADSVVGSGESWIADLSDNELADLVALGSTP
ncbi:DEAD/DEAH box helicase [Actinopolymorpha cephalotaxi]|uniref:Superfamily II DNA or RNA helicase n=1 Tax=Actinopolymorpha cephalotaxi TaxID=504797 RepID=A0ABX2S6I4_9ACTN|nr:SNF2-related protein [Actinopolymorpha cephalotaxi]NYH83937.1 superfamily II DNA or RNA helicase [Actinopolymorpha cephalotaxi]